MWGLELLRLVDFCLGVITHVILCPTLLGGAIVVVSQFDISHGWDVTDWREIKKYALWICNLLLLLADNIC